MALRALPHLIGFVIPALIVAGARRGGAWTFVTVAFIYGLVPLVDWLSALDTRNPSPGEAGALERSPPFRLLTWAWVPVQLALVAWGLVTVTGGGHTPVEVVGITLSVGLAAGAIGITFAHELIHRPGGWERALGEVLLAAVSYTHFAIEHVEGHHRSVATPRDPATARFGESFYAFYPRTVLGGVRSAWRLEVARLARRGRRAWHPANRMLRYAAVQVALYGVVAWRFGVPGVTFLAVQALIAFSLLEVINYVEHYGLTRREVAPGRFERVMPWHSWNSSHRMSNWVLINLARHSDHHYLASKRYQTLEHLDAAPQLPAGYGTMFLVALVPPLWRRVMDPKVLAWRAAHGAAGGL
jgi:alkane 1-monooxygenase